MSPALLQLDQVTIRFGGLTAVNAVDFASARANSAVSSVRTAPARPPSSTSSPACIRRPRAPSPSPDATCAACASNQIAGLGIARTFQNIRLFGSLSVFDNVRAACNLHRATGPLQTLVRLGAFRRDEAAIARRAEELLELFNLGRFRDAPAKSLPYGEQRRLESCAPSPPARACSCSTSPPPA
jgi:ABC-type branched-subunit amino acid transport system ATPase component